MRRLCAAVIASLSTLMLLAVPAMANTTYNVSHASSGGSKTVIFNHNCAQFGSSTSYHVVVCADLRYTEFYFHDINYSSSTTNVSGRTQVFCANGATTIHCVGVSIFAAFGDDATGTHSESWRCGSYGGAACAGNGARNYTTWLGSQGAIDVWTWGHSHDCDSNVKEQSWSGNIYVTATKKIATATVASPVYNVCDSV
jgi:hypothetical protein